MSDLFSKKLTVCIDAGNLSGYLALGPTLEMIRELGVETAWLPLTDGLQRLSARQPNDVVDDPLAAYKARRARARERWAHQELTRDCARLGISVDAGARRFDSRLAGMGLMYLNRRDGDIGDYMRAVYERAFHDGADISRVDEIAGLVGEDAFRSYVESAGPAALDEVQDELLDAGVFSSPAYICHGEVFHGRQHLPLLRCYLGGDTV